MSGDVAIERGIGSEVVLVPPSAVRVAGNGCAISAGHDRLDTVFFIGYHAMASTIPYFYACVDYSHALLLSDAR